MKRKLLRFTVLAAALSVSSILTFGLAQTSEIRIAIPEEGDTLDPAHMSQAFSFAVATNIYSGLVRYAPGTIEPVPDLATSWETSDDGLVWTFHIRDDVVWQQGYGKLVAQDIVDSFERIMDPDTGSRWQGELASVESIVAPDDETVVFNLKQANAAFLHSVAAFRQGLITNKQALADLGEDYERNPVGTGAYELVEWTPGVEFVLQANPDYYEGAPEIEEATFVLVADEAVRMQSLLRGEVDIAMQLENPVTYADLSEHPDISTGDGTSTTTVRISLNLRMEPFDDVRVRQALLHALDREAIAEFVEGGLAIPAYSDLAPSLLGHTEDVPHYDYDPEKARELLAEAGYPDGFETTLYWLSSFDTELLGTVRAMWREVGVDAAVQMQDGGSWVVSMASGEAPMILALGGRFDPHIWYSTFFHSSAFPPGMNGMFYSGADEFIDAGVVELDPDARAEIYADAQRQIMTDLPMLPLFWPTSTHPYWNYVEGWETRLQSDAWLYPVRINR